MAGYLTVAFATGVLPDPAYTGALAPVALEALTLVCPELYTGVELALGDDDSIAAAAGAVLGAAAGA